MRPLWGGSHAAQPGVRAGVREKDFLIVGAWEPPEAGVVSQAATLDIALMMDGNDGL